jgi:type I restriction enzyme S subunit
MKIGPFGSQLTIENLIPAGYKVYGQENVISGDFSAGTRFISEDKYKDLSVYTITPGDILITMMGTSGRCATFPEGSASGIMDSHLMRIRVTDEIDSRFFQRLIDESIYVEYQVRIQGKGSIMHGLNSGIVRDLWIAVPPITEQMTINTFLDRETTKIDALIAEQRTLIERLREKRLAEITRAVTQGLDSDVRTMDSGNPWIGFIPVHWQMKQFRQFTSALDQGWSPLAEDHEADIEEWAVIKLSAIKQGRFNETEHKTLPKHLDIPVGLEIRPGDLLFTRANTPDLVGDVCVVGETRAKLIFSDLVFRPRLDEKLADAKFLMYFLLSKCGRAQIECAARGSSQSMVKVSQGMINGWRVPLPPLAEQREIVHTLDRELGALDRLIAEAENSTALLKEHRLALIDAVVTGKVDVRDAMKESA